MVFSHSFLARLRFAFHFPCNLPNACRYHCGRLAFADLLNPLQLWLLLVGKSVSSFAFLSLFGIDKEYTTHLTMGLLLAHFISGAKHCVCLLKWVRTCVSVCWCVYVHTHLQKHTVETISPQLLSHRAGNSLLVSTSSHTTPFLIFFRYKQRRCVQISLISK